MKLEKGSKLKISKKITKAEDLIAIKNGENLEIYYSDGSSVILEGFYALEDVSLELPTSENESHLLSSVLEDSSEISVIYAQGDMSKFSSLFENNESLLNALNDYNHSLSGMNAGDNVAAGAEAANTGLGGISTTTLVVGGLVVGGIAVAASSGGSGGGSSSSSNSSSSSSTISQLQDNAVAGADVYVNGVYVTTTDENGYFTHNAKAGDVVTFKIANITIGSMNASNIPADGKVFPQDILGVDRSDTTNEAVVKMAQMLQTLDSDGDASNGITIKKDEAGNIVNDSNDVVVESSTNANLSSTSDLRTLVTLNTKVVSQLDAVEHLNNTIKTTTTTTVKTPLAVSVEAGVKSGANYTVQGTKNGDTVTVTLKDTDTTQTFIYQISVVDGVATVKLLPNNTVVSGATLNSDGTVSFSAPIDTNNLTNTITTSIQAVNEGVTRTGLEDVTNIDVTGPTATIVAPTAVLANGNYLYTIKFNEAVKDFTSADVTLTNATLATFKAVSNKTFTVEVTPTEDMVGSITLAIGTNYTDIAGNTGNTASNNSVNFDTEAPTITINTLGTNGIVIENDVDLHGLSVFTTDDNNATTTMTFNGQTYTTADIPASAFENLTSGDYTITVKATDTAGNSSTETVTFTYALDPIITINKVSSDDLINASEASSLTISGKYANLDTNSQEILLSINDQPMSPTSVSNGVWEYILNNVNANVEIVASIIDTSSSNSDVITSASKTITYDGIADVDSDVAVAITETIVNNAGKTAVEYTVSGLDSDATAVVTFEDASHNTVIANVSENGTFTIDLSDLPDGLIIASINSTDHAGNTISGITDTVTLDTSADADTTTLSLSGSITAEVWEPQTALLGKDSDIESYQIILDDGTNEPLIINQDVQSINLSSLIDGEISYTINATDADWKHCNKNRNNHKRLNS